MKFGSLFTGIGGFDLGFERAGMECCWQSELDKQASSVLARQWPGVRRYRHVESINYRTGKAYRRYYKPEPVDLICGGFPCQDVSVAGKRAGLAGERSGLWFEFRRILDQSRPEWVVIENVPGLLSSHTGRDFAVILRGLVELGYGGAWRILDAQYFGLAQLRRRVFIIGHLGDGRASEVLLEREGGGRDTAPSRETGASVAGTIGSSIDRSSSPGGGGLRQDLDSMTYVTNAFNGYTGGPDDNDAQGRHLVTAWDNGQGDPNADSDGTAFSLNPQGKQGVMVARGQTARQSRLDGDSDNFVPHTLRGEGHDAGAISSEPGMKQQNYLSGGTGVRRLMPVECERLQGFPDGWTDGQKDSHRYRQLGNAVAVPCAEWIGRRILEASA